MLKQLRSKKAMKRVMFWTLVLTIPSFVFFYGWSKSQQRDDFRDRAVARVKDRWFGLRWRPLGVGDRDLAADRLTNEIQQWAAGRGMRIPRDEARNLLGGREVAREAINTYYLKRLAREKGLGVTQAEIDTILQQMFAGSANPKADYERFLKYQRQSSDRFKWTLANEHMLAKAEAHIASRAKASLFELWQEYLISQESIQISYVSIPSKQFRDQVEVTTDSLLLYYQDHKEDYRIRDRVKYRYAAVFREDLEKDVDPTTDSVIAFYEENKDDLFRQKYAVTVRHIYRKAALDNETSFTAAREVIGKVEEKIKAGADFAEMANEWTEDTNNQPNPEDPASRRGGLLPYSITQDTTVPFGEAFKQAALALKPDEVSTPVRTPFGYHLIKADSVTTAGVLTFEEVKDRARRALKDKLVDARFRQRGENLKALFADSSYSTLDAFADAAGLQVQETELLEYADGNVPRIGSVRDHFELIEELKEGEFIEGVLRYPSQNPYVYYVLELNKRVPSDIQPFDEVLEEVRLDYVTSQSAHLAHTVASDMRRKAKTLDDLKQVAKEKGYEVDQTTTFTRESLARPGSILPNLDPGFLHATLRYKVGSIHVTTQGDPKRPTAYIVWYFEKREPPPLEQFRQDLPMIQLEYLRGVQQGLIVEWLHDMRKRIPAKSSYLEPPDKQREDQGG